MKAYKPGKFTTLVFLLTFVLVTLGIIAVYNASVVEGYRDFGDKFHFARQQLKWGGIGLVALFVAYRIPLVTLKRLAPFIFFSALFLMLLVIIPGVGTKVLGARRWISIAGFSLQPSEFMKLALVIYLSTWLEKPQPISRFLFVIASVVGLTMLQPDLGTAIVISSAAFLLYYFSGVPLTHLFFVIAGAGAAGIMLILGSDYRRARLSTFLDPTNDPLGSSYHINQVLLALGSGGLTGVGIGRSRQKYSYLPEATTDSIFAIIGEEMGFIGATIIISLLISLSLVGFKIAARSQNRFNQLLAAGISSWIAAQILLNLSAMVALVPLTGIPLPLISYGGSAMISMLAGIGLLANVARSERL